MKNVKALSKVAIIISITYGLPLAGAPELMLHWKFITLVILAAAMLLTQPTFDTGEAKKKKESDQGSVFLILGCGLLSQIIPLIEWTFFRPAVVEGAAVWTIIGGIMLVGGLAFRIWSIHTLGKFFTATVQIVEGHRVIKHGPYAIVRHPSYLGAYISIVGAAVFLAAPVGSLSAIILMAIAYKKRLKTEEVTLTKQFGKEYSDYMKTVPMIVPYRS